jgi:hypothetical protein
MPRHTAIYGLYDPREPEMIWYVGKGLSERAETHWYHFGRFGAAVCLDKGLENKLVLAWFETLRSAGVEPSWRFIDTNVPADNWQDHEKWWITWWRDINPNLCNVCSGGNSPEEYSAMGGRTGAGGRAAKAKRAGIFAPGFDRSAAGRAAAATHKKLGAGFYAISPAARTKNGIAGGRVAGKLNAAKPKYFSKIGSKGGTVNLQNKTGIFGLTAEQRLVNGHTSAHRWHRGVVNKYCSLCKEEANGQTAA